MPAPLTTAALVFAFVLVLAGADVAAIIEGAVGVLNQVLVTIAPPPREPGDVEVP